MMYDQYIRKWTFGRGRLDVKQIFFFSVEKMRKNENVKN